MVISQLSKYYSELQQLYIKEYVIPKQKGIKPDLDDFVNEGHAVKRKISKV